MGKIRKKHSPQFNAKIALAAIQNDENIAQIAGDQHRRNNRDRVRRKKQCHGPVGEIEGLLVERKQRRDDAGSHGEDHHCNEGVPGTARHEATADLLSRRGILNVIAAATRRNTAATSVAA